MTINSNQQWCDQCDEEDDVIDHDDDDVTRELGPYEQRAKAWHDAVMEG